MSRSQKLWFLLRVALGFYTLLWAFMSLAMITLRCLAVSVQAACCAGLFVSLPSC